MRRRKNVMLLLSYSITIQETMMCLSEFSINTAILYENRIEM